MPDEDTFLAVAALAPSVEFKDKDISAILTDIEVGLSIFPLDSARIWVEPKWYTILPADLFGEDIITGSLKAHG